MSDNTLFYAFAKHDILDCIDYDNFNPLKKGLIELGITEEMTEHITTVLADATWYCDIEWRKILDYDLEPTIEMISAKTTVDIDIVREVVFAVAAIFKLPNEDSCQVIGSDKFIYSGDRNITEYSIPQFVLTDWGVAEIHSVGEVIVENDDGDEEHKYPFEGCTSLKSITIPSSVTEIDRNAFGDCPVLESIKVSKDNPEYCDIDGVLYNKDCTSLIEYPLCKPGDHFTVPATVTNICNNAFAGCDLKSITISDSVTEIGPSCFYGCRHLKSITLPNSVTEIGRGVFSWCTSLESITIPDSVTRIDDKAFGYCTSLKSITIPDSVIEIGGYAFGYCKFLESITISNSVTEIRSGTFRYCTSLKSITLPDSVIEIGDDAFCECFSMKTIVLQSSVTRIGKHAFMHCTSLESITIPDSVIEIGDDAFCDCPSLGPITPPTSVRKFGNNVFDNYPTTVTISDSVTVIDLDDFHNRTTLESIKVSEDSQSYCDIDGVLYSKDRTTLMRYPIAKPGELFVVPDTVTKIDMRAFMDCRSLKTIILPDSVEEIGNYAFANCSALENINIPDSVTDLGNWTFKNCSSLESASILGSMEIIANYLFEGCTSLKSITLSGSVRMIGYAVNGHPSLESITVTKDNPMYCDIDGVLYNKDCTELIRYPGSKPGNHFSVPDSVREIYLGAFRDCRFLESIIIPNSVTKIGYDAFIRCNSLKTVTIPYSIKDMVIIEFDENTKVIRK